MINIRNSQSWLWQGLHIRLSLCFLLMIKFTSSNIMPDFSPREDIVITKYLEGSTTPVGSVIHRFKGTDRDGDSLTFNISGEERVKLGDIFRLDRISKMEANLVLQQEFDREKVSEYIVEASLTDGRSPKPTTQTLLLIIEDANDNSPIFSPFPSTVEIPENGQVPFVIANAKAEDVDEGPNGEVLYSLELDAEDEGRFNISVVNNYAVVHLLKQLDFEKKSKYKLKLIASDNPLKHEEARVTEIDIALKVVDMDDTDPVFLSSPPFTKLREDVRRGTVVCEVRAKDGDVGVNSRISYELLNEKDRFEIDPESGTITTKAGLDYETSAEGSYTLKIKAIEEDSKRFPKPFVQTEIVVGIIDVDESPKFRNETYQGSIPENSPPGFPVSFNRGLIPEVYDNDLGGKSLIKLYVDGEGGTFEVTPKQGYAKVRFQIIVRDLYQLDYESLKEIIFYLIAEDSSKNRTIITVSVLITDVNDNAPEFTSNNYWAKIPENPPIGLEVITVQASDRDTGYFGTRGIRFTTLKGLGADELHLDTKTGQITVRQENSSIFDRELYPSLFLTVEARDLGGKGNSNFTVITVELEDINDNEPTFLQSFYEAEIHENVENTLLPVLFSANDKDQLGTKNSRVEFLISSSAENSTLELNPTTGQIRIGKAFDFESIAKIFSPQGNWNSDGMKILINYSIQAYDLGNPRLTSKTNFTLILLDKNDCRPEFSQNYYEIKIPENFNGDKAILQVSAEDKDISAIYNKITYSIVGGEDSTKFSINSSTGVISFVQGTPLDYDGEPLYKIEVCARDDVGLRSEKNAMVKVIIQDVNNKPPRFIFPEVFKEDNDLAVCSSGKDYHFKMEENTSPGEIIAKLHATDPDTTAALRYTVNFTTAKVFKNGKDANVTNLNNYFNVHNRTGLLTTGAKPFDYEIMDKLWLTVKVTDVEGIVNMPQDDVAYVIVDIVNVFDNPPKFRDDQFSSEILENSPLGTVILEVKAESEVSKGEGIKYSLIPGSSLAIPPLEIDSTTGDLKVSGKIDRETCPWINITIRATENKSEKRLTKDVPIFVKILDENDNTPVFTDSNKILTIPEDTPVGQIITKVVANDADDGIFGTVGYFLQGNSLHEKFAIDPITGSVTLVESLDYETEDEYKLSIKAVDNFNGTFESTFGQNCRSAKTILTVHILDVNDHSPEILFESVKPPINVSQLGSLILKENFQGVVISFKVRDGDQINSANSQVRVNLSCNSSKTTFKLVKRNNNYWEIVSSTSLKGMAGKYTLNVTATDEGIPQKSTVKSVRVTVTKPTLAASKDEIKFSRKKYAGGISAGNKNGTQLLELSLTQAISVDPDANLTFSIESPLHLYDKYMHHEFIIPLDSPLFLVNPKSGVISLNFNVVQEGGGYFEANLTISNANILLDTSKLFIYYVKAEEKIDLFSNLPREEAQAQSRNLVHDLEDIFHLSVTHDLDFDIDKVLSEKGILSYTQPHSVFRLSVACPQTHKILQASHLMKLFTTSTSLLIEIFEKYEIHHSLKVSALLPNILQDSTIAYLYFAMALAFFLFCNVLTLIILCVVSHVKGRKSNSLKVHDLVFENRREKTVLNLDDQGPPTDDTDC